MDGWRGGLRVQVVREDRRVTPRFRLMFRSTNASPPRTGQRDSNRFSRIKGRREKLHMSKESFSDLPSVLRNRPVMIGKLR